MDMKVIKHINKIYLGLLRMDQRKFVRLVTTDHSLPELKMPRFVGKNWAKHHKSLIQIIPATDTYDDKSDMHVNTYPIAKSEILGNGSCENTSIIAKELQAVCTCEELFKVLNFPFQTLKSKDFPLFDFSQSVDQLQVMADNLLQMRAGNFPHDACVPSVSSILQTTVTASKDSEWQCWKLKIIQDHGIEAFLKYLEEMYISECRLRKRIFNYLTGKPESACGAQTDGYWHSIQKFLPHLSNIISVEQKIKHPFLQYTGVIDCIGTFSNQQVLIEWCTPYKFLPILRNGCDRPLQAVAYFGALNAQSKEPTLVNKILLVVAYPNGDTASVFEVTSDLNEKLWKLWLARLADYWELRKSCPAAICNNLMLK